MRWSASIACVVFTLSAGAPLAQAAEHADDMSGAYHAGDVDPSVRVDPDPHSDHPRGMPDFAVSGGFSYLGLHDHNNLQRTHDGGFIDADFSWLVGPERFPLTLGVGISGSGFYTSHRVLVPVSSTLLAEDSLQSGIGLFAFEGRAGLPFGRADGHGWFIMPRVGVGVIVSDYSIDSVERNGGFSILRTHEHTGAAFGVRPAIEAGYGFDWGAVGFEGSFLAAFGDFGAFGNRAEEYRAGVFVRFRV